MHIVILVICIIIYIAMILVTSRPGPMRAYNGIFAQIQVVASTVMVITNMKRGFIVACILNAMNAAHSLVKFVQSSDASSTPGIVIPVITILTVSIIFINASNNVKMSQELTEQYEKTMDSNRIIQEQNDSLKAMTYTDRMTGIPNRQYFLEQLEDAIRLGMPFSVIYADIDNFKMINDQLGPKTGDAALIAYAELVSSYCGRKYKFARAAGDEFAILITGEQSEADILNIIEQLRRMFMEPVNALGTPVSVTMSYGIVAHPRDGKNPDALLDSAIMATYNAKANGKDRPCFFSPAN